MSRTPEVDGSQILTTLSTPDTTPWPVPTAAQEILPAGVFDGDHDQWLATRREGLGGSDIAAVLGHNPWHSPYQVWLDKTGKTRPIRDTYIMRRGRYYEPTVSQWFADQTGVATRKTGTWARTEPGTEWMRCNPDRFTDDGYGLEVKMPSSEWAAQWKDGPAFYAVVQALWCAHVTGLPAWYLAADVDQGAGPDLPVWQLVAEEWAEQLAYWEEFAEWWWFRYVVTDTPPSVDSSEATAEALSWAYRTPVRIGGLVRVPGLRDKVTRRAELKEEIKGKEEELRGVENWIKAALEHDETGCDEDDVPIVAWRPVGVDPLDETMPKSRALREIKPPKAKTKTTRKRVATADA